MKVRQKLFVFHIIQCFSFMTESIKLNGSCPEIATEDHFACSSSAGLKTFFPLAHLPIDNNSLNLFFNPFNLMECLGFTMHCYPNGASFKLELSCTPDDLENAVEFCALPEIHVKAKSNSTVEFNYVVDEDEICPRISEHVKLVKYVENKYLILHSCEKDADTHVEGAWILASKNITGDLEKVTQEAMGYLKNSSARQTDFVMFNSSLKSSNLNGTQCGCHFEQDDPCEFFTRCKIEGGNAADYFYDGEEYYEEE